MFYMYIVTAIHVTLLLFRLSLGQEFRVEGSFRTALSEGVLLFNGGDRPQDPFFLVELYRGRLYLVLDFGDGVKRFAFPDVAVDDALEHEFVIDRDRRFVTLSHLKH